MAKEKEADAAKAGSQVYEIPNSGFENPILFFENSIFPDNKLFFDF